MVDVPFFLLAQLLPAYPTASLLLLVQPRYLPASFQARLHLLVQTFLEVAFPFRVIRVGFAPDLNMPSDAHLACLQQADRPRPPFAVLERAGEHPVAASYPLE